MNDFKTAHALFETHIILMKLNDVCVMWKIKQIEAYIFV